MDLALPANIEIGDGVISSLLVEKRKRSIHDRPENWRIIAAHYDLWGRSKTWEIFKDDLCDRSQRSIDQALRTWSRDLKENKEGLRGKRAPAYGFSIDLKLLKEVRERLNQNLAVDDVTLHSLLVHQLELHGKLELMTEYGGSHMFLHGWAGRFW